MKPIRAIRTADRQMHRLEGSGLFTNVRVPAVSFAKAGK